jgi:hypothetical protein
VSFSSLGLPPAKRIYDRWNDAIVAVIEQAMYQAWDRVRLSHPTLLTAANEDHITDQLKVELVALRRSNTPEGFNCQVFGVPVRDGKLRSGSGHSIDMMPDLTFYLVGCRVDVDEDDHDALFFECKVLDATRGLSLYDKNGLTRFVDGHYASRMPQAGMVAYALGKKHTCPETSLPAYLDNTAKGASQTNGQRLGWDSKKSSTAPSPGAFCAKIWESVHGRQFLGHLTIKPDPISIRHLWLTA